MLRAAGDVDVDVLTRQEVWCRCIDVEFENDGRVVVLLDLRYRRDEPALLSLARTGRCRHCNHTVALRHHLAGEDETPVLLVVAQGVFDIVVTQIVTATFGATLTGAA